MWIFRKASKASGFVEKTIIDILSFLKESIYNEDTAAINGFLQNCDPRAKLIAALFFLISSLLSKNPIELAVNYVIVLFTCLISFVNLIYFLKRTLLFIPLFSLIIIIPALFSFVTPGKPVMIFNFHFFNFAVTVEGISTGLTFFMRVLTSVSIVILLILTTRSYMLLKALRMVGIPHIFTMIFGMTYRYIFLLLDIIQKTYIAVKSRTGHIKSTVKGQSVAGVTIAGLWLKSYQMQNQIYDAMISRGFTGEPVVDFSFQIKIIDLIIVLISISTLIGTLWLNRCSN